MVRCADQATENVTRLLIQRRMWDNTLMLFASDNGATQMGMGNNYPLVPPPYNPLDLPSTPLVRPTCTRHTQAAQLAHLGSSTATRT